jgi:hypothetical protein
VRNKHRPTHGVEVKATKQKFSVVVRKLKKKVTRNKILHGEMIVSQEGFTKSAEKEAKKSRIKPFKYKQKRKKIRIHSIDSIQIKRWEN